MKKIFALVMITMMAVSGVASATWLAHNEVPVPDSVQKGKEIAHIEIPTPGDFGLLSPSALV